MNGPILIVNDMPEPPKKLRKVDIFKNEVFKDIDLYTHKHVDAREDMGLRSGNAVSSDVTEKVDGAVIARYVEFWDAQLRTKVQFALCDRVQEYATDEISIKDSMYRYWFEVPVEFDDNALRPLAEHIHRFLVWGALYDWYSQFGMQQAAVYGSELDRLEEQIKSLLRGKSIVKRPLQPFGPAKKIYW